VQYLPDTYSSECNYHGLVAAEHEEWVSACNGYMRFPDLWYKPRFRLSSSRIDARSGIGDCLKSEMHVDSTREEVCEKVIY